MNKKQKWAVILLVFVTAACILAGGFFYITSVNKSLWMNAVTNILEVTDQGRHALDIYLQKDRETLHLLAGELGDKDSTDTDALMEEIRLFSQDGVSYICADLDKGLVYSSELKSGVVLDDTQLDIFKELTGQGVRDPFLSGYTGIWTFGIYERFAFADGTEGLVQKTVPLYDMARRFSLSFYNDTGFSYIVNHNGDILVRSQHRNSNRTFQNLFDIIDLQGNAPEEINSFRLALQSGKKGVARFKDKQKDTVFCYVPLQNAADWYVVSIVPNDVVMEQAGKIIRQSLILFFMIVAGIFIVTAVFLIYRESSRRILMAEETARRAAESANVAKSRFLSNMSHDIRTPMNAVISMTKLAADHLDEPGKVREYLKNIAASGQLLISLINDILDLSKIESGKMALNNDTASLADLMYSLVTVIQPSIHAKNQQFNVRLHDIDHETIYFDSLRLNQILLNLLSNAIKFTPEGGSISVDVTESPSSKEGFGHFTFRIADTGIGIKPEFQEHIFESFTREEEGRVRKTEGTGLGMAITRMIVDMMKGTISVESAPGAGTVFTVELDLMLSSELSEQTGALPSMRVLAADDDPFTRISVQKYLDELGIDVDIAESGTEAVRMAGEAHSQGRDYRLILLDWKMPGMDGIQTVREIRETVQTCIPVIIFSAYDWSTIELQAKEAGVTGFIQKPIFKSSLSRCIRYYVLKEEQKVPGTREEVNLSGRRILVAEDNELNREIAKEILEGVGAEVVLVNNGQECVNCFELCTPGYFDLILMDIQMPVMNGYETTRQIRKSAHEDAAEIPIFAMTADAFAEDIEEAKKAGMNAHLTKPLDIPAMLREIERSLPCQS